MNKLSRSLLLLSLLICTYACQKEEKVAKPTPIIDESLFSSITSCQEGSNTDHFVYFLKQWHLGPKADTAVRPPADFPQYRNQQAIFAQLIEWSHKDIAGTVLMEGCEGELGSNIKARFNGHDVESLSKLSDDDLSYVLTHLGLKYYVYSARHPSRLKVKCGDDQKLIEAHSLSFSDLRGYMGFYDRLAHNKNSNPDLYQKYAAGAREVLKLGATGGEVEEALKEKIVEKIDLFESYIKERNDVFLREVQENKGNSFVVLGGVHAKDFQEKLEALGIGCKIMTPLGYPDVDDGAIIKELKEKFSHLPERS